MKTFVTTLIFATITITGITNRLTAQTQDSTKEKAKQAPAEDFRDDWADLRHYEAENKTLPSPAKNEKRVVFLGSSIFENWKSLVPSYWENKAYVNRGISGQISPQLLLRFRQDVINLKPAAVIILAGSNDISGTTGHVTNERILENIRSMTELAQLHKIKVILCAYLPINEYPWRKGFEPAEKIISLNNAIIDYARAKKLTVLDYYTPLVDDRKGQKPELSLDGVHPNAAGYAIMARVTDELINKVIR
ncbi:MAG: acylhydrolase [Chitinophagaceae bacterium]|nr:MAG: acylhydrolase [Chitinophagaceae bacterium]